MVNSDLTTQVSTQLLAILKQTNMRTRKKPMVLTSKSCIETLISEDETGDRDSQEGIQRVNGKGDQTSCNEWRILSVDVAEIKLDLSLLWMKVINSAVREPGFKIGSISILSLSTQSPRMQFFDRVGTNNLHNKKPSDIMQTSIITRNDDENGVMR